MIAMCKAMMNYKSEMEGLQKLIDFKCNGFFGNDFFNWCLNIVLVVMI